MARKLVVVAVILLLLLLVIPLGIGMVMAPCPECEAGFPMSPIAGCLAVLLAFGLLAAPGVAETIRSGPERRRPLLVIRDLDPPPRSV